MCRHVKKQSEIPAVDENQSEIPAKDEKEPEIPVEDKKFDFFMHMHQLDRNELIARIQQRDQYIICYIGAFIAFLVGLLQAQSDSNLPNTSTEILLGCFVAWLLMILLTYRLLSSYSIHKKLIEHTQAIEALFNEKCRPYFWQNYIETRNPKHRKISFSITVAIIIVVDFLVITALIYHMIEKSGDTTILHSMTIFTQP